MRKELFCILNMSLWYSATEHLEDVNIRLMEGTCTGLLGVADSGKDLLVSVLRGKLFPEHGQIYIGKQRVKGAAALAEAVYQMSDSNYVIDDWTVAEYIGLVSDELQRGRMKKRELEQKVQAVLTQLGLEVSARKRLKELSEMDKRLMDIAKAYIKRAKILLIRDEFESFTMEDIQKFKGVLDRIAGKDIAVVIDTHSEAVSATLSDEYIIFRKGRISKKCKKEYIENNRHLEQFLLSETSVQIPPSFYRADKKEKVQYQVSDMFPGGTYIEICFYEGEIITLLEADQKQKQYLFEVLSGWKRTKDIRYNLQGQQLKGGAITHFIGKRVVAIERLGSETELLSNMSASENLLIPSLTKIPSLQYVIKEKSIVAMLKRKVLERLADEGERIENLTVNDRILLTLERWYIYKPKVLVLFEPFARCDAYGIALVKSYIRKFSEIGTSVVVIKSRAEYMEDVSERIINHF